MPVPHHATCGTRRFHAETTRSGSMRHAACDTGKSSSRSHTRRHVARKPKPHDHAILASPQAEWHASLFNQKPCDHATGCMQYLQVFKRRAHRETQKMWHTKRKLHNHAVCCDNCPFQAEATSGDIWGTRRVALQAETTTMRHVACDSCHSSSGSHIVWHAVCSTRHS